MRRVLWTALALVVAISGSSLIATADGTGASKGACDASKAACGGQAACAAKSDCDPGSCAKAGDCCKDGKGCCGSCETPCPDCPLAAKTAKLTERWKTALAAVETGCPKSRERLAAKVAELRAACPTGTRMESTLVTAQSVLAALERSGKACPQAAAAPSTVDAGTAAAKTASSCCPAEAAAAGRAAVATKEPGSGTSYIAMVRELHELTDLTLRGARLYHSSKEPCGTAKSGACATAEATSCETKQGATSVALGGCAKSAGTTVAVGGPGSCDGVAPKGACGSSVATEPTAGHCPASLLASVQALRESWGKVPAEYQSMCPQKREELLQVGQALLRESPVFALMPQTVETLASGMEQLATLHGRVASAHGETLSTTFQAESRLLEESARLLAEVRTALKPAGEAPAPQVVLHER